MKRVVFFAPNYLPAMRYGGPVHSAHGLARGLVGLGHHVDMLTTNVDGPDKLNVPIDGPLVLDGVHVHYCPVTVPRRIYHSPALARRAAELLPRADAVHINGMFLWPGPYLARAARSTGKTLIISPRGMLMPEMVAGKSWIAKKAWIAMQERANIAAATAIHVTSEVEAAGLRAMALDLAPIAVIGNGVEMPKTPPRPEEIAEIWGDVPVGRRVAFLARLDWTKGVDMAIAAVRAHPNAVILLAGHDQIGLRSEFEKRLWRDNGGVCGNFLGPLDGQQKWAFLAGADVLLVPSISESFGMSVVEALAVGTPVIATEEVGASTLLQRLDPRLVVTRDQSSLNLALAELLQDDSRRASLGEAAKILAATELSWSATAARMVHLYEGNEGRR